MLKVTFKTMLLLLFAFVIFNSCKKNNDQKPKTELLTQKEWGMSKYEIKSGSGQWSDETQYWPTCSKDDRFVFRTNQTIEHNEGATKCDPADPQIVATSPWAFTDNEKTITWFNKSSAIEQLNETTLIVITTEVTGGVTISERITFVH